MSTKQMSRIAISKVKFTIFGAVVGAIAATIVGFSFGGWVTAATASDITDSAVLTSRAEICAAQFSMDPEHEAKLKEFQEMQSWNRGEFIREGGWDKMPGEEEANITVAHACRMALEAM